MVKECKPADANADCNSRSGTRERGRPRKRQRDKAEERLCTVGITRWQALSRDRWELRKIVLEDKVQNGLVREVGEQREGGGGGGGGGRRRRRRRRRKTTNAKMFLESMFLHSWHIIM